MEAGAEPGIADPRAGSPWPGLAACLAVALAAAGAASGLERTAIRLDATFLALAFGIALAPIAGRAGRLHAGSLLSVERVLPVSIALLGARLDLQSVLGVGGRSLLLALVVLATSGVTLVGLGRWLGLSGRTAGLLALGTGICGASAIATAAPMLGARREEVATAVTSTVLIGFVAMTILPVTGALLGMDERSFGVWAGLAIQQTPQVLAAAFSYGPEAGETATVVKLARICLLAPVVLALGLLRREPGSVRRRRLGRAFPVFVLGLLALATLRSLGLLPDVSLGFPAGRPLALGELHFSVSELAAGLAHWGLTIAMAGVGLGTDVRALLASAPRALAAAGLGWLVIAAVAAAGLAWI